MKVTKQNKIHLILFFPYLLLSYLAINSGIQNRNDKSYVVLCITILTTLIVLSFMVKLNKKRDDI